MTFSVSLDTIMADWAAAIDKTAAEREADPAYQQCACPWEQVFVTPGGREVRAVPAAALTLFREAWHELRKTHRCEMDEKGWPRFVLLEEGTAHD